MPKASPEGKQGMVHGGLRLEVISFAIGKPKVGRSTFGGSKEEVLEEEYAIVRLKLTNVTEVKKIDYTSPSDVNEWSVSDEFENRYHSHCGGSMSRYSVIEGVKWRYKAPIYPGKDFEEVMLFQVPVSRAKHLVLELDGSSWGADGKVRIAFARDAK